MTTETEILATLDPHKPLLLLDADEVLLRFVERLEAYLLTQGVELRLSSFQLSGNMYPVGADTPLPDDRTPGLIAGFFDDCVDDVPLVEGAKDALDDLSSSHQIVILTNVPSRCRARREASLHDMGLTYPVLANKGEKGPAAQRLAASVKAGTVFVDDLPPQISSVASHAPDTHRVHFIGDPRLARLIGKAPDAHERFDLWRDLHTHLQARTSD